MSERLLKILLEELETVRVVCVNCKTAFDFPLKNLDGAFSAKEGNEERWECPHCHNLVQGGTSGKATRGPFHPLLKAISLLKDLKDKVEVQFVVREGD
jgi:hypothetical protein